MTYILFLYDKECNLLFLYNNKYMNNIQFDYMENDKIEGCVLFRSCTNIQLNFHNFLKYSFWAKNVAKHAIYYNISVGIEWAIYNNCHYIFTLCMCNNKYVAEKHIIINHNELIQMIKTIIIRWTSTN